MSAEAEETRPPSTEVGLACLLSFVCGVWIMGVDRRVGLGCLSSVVTSASEREGKGGRGRLPGLPRACTMWAGVVGAHRRRSIDLSPRGPRGSTQSMPQPNGLYAYAHTPLPHKPT